MSRYGVTVLALSLFLAGTAGAAGHTSRVVVRGGYTDPQLALTAAPSVVVGDGVALPGVNLELAGRPVSDVPLYLTLDSGPFFYTSFDFRVIVPILFGMDYELAIRGSKIHPLFGVAVGPVVGKRVVFGMLFRPGLNVSIGRGIALNFEPRLGVFASSFVFVPQFGARFEL